MADVRSFASASGSPSKLAKAAGIANAVMSFASMAFSIASAHELNKEQQRLEALTDE